jgi:hypothetical protein
LGRSPLSPRQVRDLGWLLVWSIACSNHRGLKASLKALKSRY